MRRSKEQRFSCAALAAHFCFDKEALLFKLKKSDAKSKDRKNPQEIKNKRKERDFTYCSNCGREIMVGAAFCSNCGMQIPLIGTVENGRFSGPGDSKAVLSGFLSRITAAGVIWLIIGILQIICGLFTIIFGIGLVTIAFGIWNICQGGARLGTSSRFAKDPTGVASYASRRGSGEIAILVLNIFFGALFGIAGAILDIVTTQYGKDHLRDLEMAEIYEASGMMVGTMPVL